MRGRCSCKYFIGQIIPHQLVMESRKAANIYDCAVLITLQSKGMLDLAVAPSHSVSVCSTDVRAGAHYL